MALGTEARATGRRPEDSRRGMVGFPGRAAAPTVAHRSHPGSPHAARRLCSALALRFRRDCPGLGRSHSNDPRDWPIESIPRGNVLGRGARLRADVQQGPVERDARHLELEWLELDASLRDPADGCGLWLQRHCVPRANQRSPARARRQHLDVDRYGLAAAQRGPHSTT